MDKQSKIEAEVDSIELDALAPNEIADIGGALKSSQFDIRTARKKVRYDLYRVRTEMNGGPASGVDSSVIKHYESDDGFDGWRNFAITWDVALVDPQHIVSRAKSQADEWQEVFDAKTPIILPGGKIVYPDKAVERKMRKVSAK